MPNNNAVRCPNNHFYDSSKFSSCPYCDEIGSDMPTFAMPASSPLVEPDGGVTLPLGAIPAPAPIPSPVSFDAIAPTMPISFPANNPMMNRGNSYEDDGQKTVSLNSFHSRVEPTAGWLICIKGPNKGKSFSIRANRNFIGRDPSMDIPIENDKHISRKKHAVITYVPKNRMFIAQPGESKELFYINDEVVLDNVVLKEYDKIEIGETKLLFIPLCGEKFSWEDFKE